MSGVEATLHLCMRKLLRPRDLAHWFAKRLVRLYFAPEYDAFCLVSSQRRALLMDVLSCMRVQRWEPWHLEFCRWHRRWKGEYVWLRN